MSNKTNDLYSPFRTEYRNAYYAGLKGLSEEARTNFMAANKDILTDDTVNDEEFRGWILKNELENNPDKNYAELWANRKTQLNTSRKRNDAFSRLALTQGFDYNSDLANESPKWGDFLANALISGAEGVPAEERYNATKNIENHQIIQKARLDDKNTIQNQARRYINERIDEEYNKVANWYDNLPRISQDNFLNQIENVSQAVSPDYYGYYGRHDKAARSREHLEDVAIRTFIWNKILGEEKASQMLKEYWQDYTANRQTQMEKAGNAGLTFLNDAASTGIMAIGLAYGLAGAPFDKEELTNEKYGANILDNAVTRWGADIFTTGHWDPQVQNELKALGVNANAILNTRDQESALLSGNTLYELFGQYGFTAASMLMGAGLGKLGQVPMTVARNAVNAGKTATKFGRFMTKAHMWSANAWQKSVPFLIAGPEANLEALTTWEESRQKGLEDINSKIENLVDKDIYDYVVENPEEAEKKIAGIQLSEQFKSENPDYISLTFGEWVRDPKTGTYKKEYSDLSLGHMAQILSENPSFREKYKQDREDDALLMQQALEESKMRQLWTTFAANQIVLGAVNNTLQATQLSSFTRRALNKNNTGRITNMIDFIEDANKAGLKAAAKKVTWKDLLTDRLKESLGEGLEEYNQALITAFGEGSTRDLVSQYVNRLYNEESIDAVVEDMSSMIEAGLKYAGETAIKKSTIKEALYGTLSTLLGGPSINTNVSFGKRKEGESTYDMLRRNFPIVWRGLNETFFSSEERKARQKENEDMANAINAFLSDESNLNLVFNIAENVGATRAYNNAIRNNDEKESRDSKVDMLFGFASMMASLRGTAFYDTTMHMLEQRVAVDRRNLSNPESKEYQMVQQYKEETGDTKMYNEDILAALSKSAKNTIDIIKQAQKEAASIAGTYGDNISLPVQNALISHSLHEKDIERRLKTLSHEYHQIDFSEPDGTTPSSNLPIEVQKGYARFGNYSQAMERKQQLTDHIEKIRKTRRSLEELSKGEEELSFALKSKISTLKYLEEKAKKEIEEIKAYENELGKLDGTVIDNIVLTAYDISRLDSRSRQRLLNTGRKHITVTEEVDGKEITRKVLDPNHRKLSSKQSTEIDKFRNRGKKSDKNFNEKINDMAILQQDLEYYEHMEMFYRTNPQILFSMSKRLEEEVAKKLASKKYSYLEDQMPEGKKYLDDFRRSIFVALNNAESETDKKAIWDAAKKSNHWKAFKKQYDQYKQLIIEIKKTDHYNKLSPESKNNLITALDATFIYHGDIYVGNNGVTVAEKFKSIPEDVLYSGIVDSDAINSSIEDFDNVYNDIATTVYEARVASEKRQVERAPIEVATENKENDVPNKSESPVVDGPVVETVENNPHIITSEQDLSKMLATKDIENFYKEHNIFDNQRRLISEGVLTTKNKVTGKATTVYFTPMNIGSTIEIVQLVEDEKGDFVIEGTKYSAIGVEFSVKAFTTEEKQSEEGKLLPRTASVVKITSNRDQSQSTNLKDIENTNVIDNLVVEERTDQKTGISKPEVRYKSQTGQGNTQWTSSVSDTAIDQVQIAEQKTPIELLNSFKNLALEEQNTAAIQMLKHLDYSINDYVAETILSNLREWENSSINDDILNKKIGRLFGSIYFLGRINGEPIGFNITKNNNNVVIAIGNESLSNPLASQTIELSDKEDNITNIVSTMLRVLAEAATNEDGSPKKTKQGRTRLSFEIGLQDIELLNNKQSLGLKGGDKKEQALRATKRKALKNKIELGILQITNNSDTVIPKKIDLAFNELGSPRVEATIQSERNADSPKSNSSTVEANTGETINAVTGEVVSEQPKVTDQIERKAQQAESSSETTPSTLSIWDQSEAVEPHREQDEKEEEEVNMDDILEASRGDNEFGGLLQIDRSQYRKDIQTLLFWHMNHPSIQKAERVYEQQVKKINSNIKKQAVQIQKNESIEGARFRMEQTVYQEAGEYKNLIKSINTYRVGNYVHAKVSFYSHQDYMLAIVRNLYKDFTNEQIHTIVEDLKQREQEASDVNFQLNKKDYSDKIVTGADYARIIKSGIVDKLSKTYKTPFVPQSESYSAKVKDLIDKVSKIDIEEAKKVLGDVFAVIDNPTEVVSSVVKDHISSLVDKYVVQPANRGLSKKLRAILKEYHVDVFEGPLKEYFGQDVKGAFSFVYKLVALAEAKDRNALTEPEEFAHAFFALMGQSISSFSKDIGYHYKQLAQDIQKTDLYKQVLVDYAEVYGNNTQKYIDEALGKALGALILEKEEINKNKSFFEKLKDFFNKILDLFRKKESTPEFTPYVSLYDELSKMATSILDGSYQDTYLERYTKEGDELNNSVVDAVKTLEEQTKKDGGRTVNIISKIQKLGGTLGGSLALSRRGTIYRKKLNLHDLDFSIGPMIHRFPRSLFKASAYDINDYIENSAFIESVKALLPNFSYLTAYRTNLGLTAHGFVSDSTEVADKFLKLPGTLSEKLAALSKEEQNQISLIDFFFDSKEIDAVLDPELGRISTEKAPFLAKAYYGRLKDIRDYQRFKSNLSVKEKMDLAFNKRVQERIEIKRKAIEDGTWKKAPNGLPSKLSDDQWITVRTKAFKEWFGDWENDPSNASQVIDLDTKEPLLVYHGSHKTFSVFGINSRPQFPGDRDGMYYFTTDKRNAASYGLHIKPVFLSIKNPLIEDFEGRVWTNVDSGGHTVGPTTDEHARQARKNGYDGAIHYNVIDTNDPQIKNAATNYVVFRSHHIKSADANTGTFDINDPDIRYQLVEEDSQHQKVSLVESLQNSADALIESWDMMSNSLRQKLENQNMPKEVWDQMTVEERKKALECI